MYLQLFVGDKLLESIPLAKEKLDNPLYILNKKKYLEEKHKHVFQAYNMKPSYYLQQQEVYQKRKML